MKVFSAVKITWSVRIFCLVIFLLSTLNGSTQVKSPDPGISYAIISANTMIPKLASTIDKNLADTLPDNPRTNPKTIRNRTEPAPVIIGTVDNTGFVPKTAIASTYDFSNVIMCLDIINNNSLPPRTNATLPKALPKINSDGVLIPVSTIQQPLAALTDKMWNAGEVITVGFFADETTPLVIKKVKEYAREWEAQANIKFVFVTDVNQAIIKVGFGKSGCWSALGRDALTYNLGNRTMNFQGLTDYFTMEYEYSRIILHEFGHALGFIHEHQSPAAGIPWDKEKTYAFFDKTYSWSRTMVDQQVFGNYSKTHTNFTSYDKFSIMHYYIPAELTTDGSSAPYNKDFSAKDKQFIKLVYPFPPTPTNATGILRTGDDCDEIVFSVEYDVLNNKNEIEFVLEPGRDANNNLITWWKKIAIPLLGNSEAGIEIQDGSSGSKKVLATLIDQSRGISFGKAKVLGVHTGLGFTWNVWPAITGGCRVKFKWRRDRC